MSRAQISTTDPLDQFQFPLPIENELPKIKNLLLTAAIYGTFGVGMIGASIGVPMPLPATITLAICGSCCILPMAGSLLTAYEYRNIETNPRMRYMRNPLNHLAQNLDEQNKYLLADNALIAMMPNNYNTDQFTHALNSIFKFQKPDDIDQDNFVNAYVAVSSIAEGAEGRMILLSRILVHLHRETEILSDVNRSVLMERYEKFCNESFMPFCSAKYGENEARVATNYINNYVVPNIEGVDFDFNQFQQTTVSYLNSVIDPILDTRTLYNVAALEEQPIQNPNRVQNNNPVGNIITVVPVSFASLNARNNLTQHE